MHRPMDSLVDGDRSNASGRYIKTCVSTIEFVVYCGTEDKYFPSAISFSWRDDWNNTPAAVFSFV